MTIEYQFAVTGFMFGLIVALDIMCICNIVSSLLKKKRIERQKEREELIKLAKQANYSDLPRKYQKILKGKNNEIKGTESKV